MPCKLAGVHGRTEERAATSAHSLPALPPASLTLEFSAEHSKIVCIISMTWLSLNSSASGSQDDEWEAAVTCERGGGEGGV
jgi:hypothetical protein